MVQTSQIAMCYTLFNSSQLPNQTKGQLFQDCPQNMTVKFEIWITWIIVWFCIRITVTVSNGRFALISRRSTLLFSTSQKSVISASFVALKFGRILFDGACSKSFLCRTATNPEIPPAKKTEKISTSVFGHTVSDGKAFLPGFSSGVCFVLLLGGSVFWKSQHTRKAKMPNVEKVKHNSLCNTYDSSAIILDVLQTEKQTQNWHTHKEMEKNTCK